MFNNLFVFIIREQTIFFEQKTWKYEKCSLNLQRSKRMNKIKTVNKYDDRRRNY